MLKNLRPTRRGQRIADWTAGLTAITLLTFASGIIERII